MKDNNQSDAQKLANNLFLQDIKNGGQDLPVMFYTNGHLERYGMEPDFGTALKGLNDKEVEPTLRILELASSLGREDTDALVTDAIKKYGGEKLFDTAVSNRMNKDLVQNIESKTLMSFKRGVVNDIVNSNDFDNKISTINVDEQVAEQSNEEEFVQDFGTGIIVHEDIEDQQVNVGDFEELEGEKLKKFNEQQKSEDVNRGQQKEQRGIEALMVSEIKNSKDFRDVMNGIETKIVNELQSGNKELNVDKIKNSVGYKEVVNDIQEQVVDRFKGQVGKQITAELQGGNVITKKAVEQQQEKLQQRQRRGTALKDLFTPQQPIEQESKDVDNMLGTGFDSVVVHENQTAKLSQDVRDAFNKQAPLKETSTKSPRPSLIKRITEFFTRPPKSPEPVSNQPVGTTPKETENTLTAERAVMEITKQVGNNKINPYKLMDAIKSTVNGFGGEGTDKGQAFLNAVINPDNRQKQLLGFAPDSDSRIEQVVQSGKNAAITHGEPSFAEAVKNLQQSNMTLEDRGASLNKNLPPRNTQGQGESKGR